MFTNFLIKYRRNQSSWVALVVIVNNRRRSPRRKIRCSQRPCGTDRSELWLSADPMRRPGQRGSSSVADYHSIVRWWAFNSPHCGPVGRMGAPPSPLRTEYTHNWHTKKQQQYSTIGRKCTLNQRLPINLSTRVRSQRALWTHQREQQRTPHRKIGRIEWWRNTLQWSPFLELGFAPFDR